MTHPIAWQDGYAAHGYGVPYAMAVGTRSPGLAAWQAGWLQAEHDARQAPQAVPQAAPAPTPLPQPPETACGALEGLETAYDDGDRDGLIHVANAINLSSDTLRLHLGDLTSAQMRVAQDAVGLCRAKVLRLGR